MHRTPSSRCGAGKEVKGRKVYALVDGEGLPMRVVVHSAAIQDRDGGGLVLDKFRGRFPWLEPIWADEGYNAWQVDAAVAKMPPRRVAVVRRSDDRKGFVVLPRRWVVERSSPGSGGTGVSPTTSRTSRKPWPTFVTPASIQLALRRLARA